jgi:uncharacterized protein YdeI (YjbR/CyaY-like superfamily)
MTPPPNSIYPESRAQWRAWLAQHCQRGQGVWLILDKKTAGTPQLTYDDAVEEALCFGWIDSRPARLDAGRSLLWVAPRKPGSRWSKPNKARAQRVLDAGLMMPAGQQKIDAAKADGNWTALDGVERLETPPDLATALAAQPPAATNFDAFPRSVKRGILEWILAARRPETRAKRIEETARLAAGNVRANQWPRQVGRAQRTPRDSR